MQSPQVCALLGWASQQALQQALLLAQFHEVAVILLLSTHFALAVQLQVMWTLQLGMSPELPMTSPAEGHKVLPTTRHRLYGRPSTSPAQAVRSRGVRSLTQQHNSAMYQLVQRLLVINCIDEGRSSALWHQQTDVSVRIGVSPPHQIA